MYTKYCTPLVTFIFLIVQTRTAFQIPYYGYHQFEGGSILHHQVQKGDTLTKIGRKHGVSVVVILNLNPHLKKRRHRIYVGEKVRVS